MVEQAEQDGLLQESASGYAPTDGKGEKGRTRDPEHEYGSFPLPGCIT